MYDKTNTRRSLEIKIDVPNLFHLNGSVSWSLHRGREREREKEIYATIRLHGQLMARGSANGIQGNRLNFPVIPTSHSISSFNCPLTFTAPTHSPNPSRHILFPDPFKFSSHQRKIENGTFPTRLPRSLDAIPIFLFNLLFWTVFFLSDFLPILFILLTTIVSIHFQRSFQSQRFSKRFYYTSVKGKSQPVTLGAPRGEQYTTYWIPAARR